uniref:Uncharacterized protein n=1 Tax=Anguilla anguilla TaxID=7936 RepID=A0A0E9XUE9_ANGAN
MLAHFQVLILITIAESLDDDNDDNEKVNLINNLENIHFLHSLYRTVIVIQYF